MILPNNTAVNGNCSAVPGWAACSANPESCTAAQMPVVNEYRASFIAAMNATGTATRVGNGGFATSCHTHCEAQGGDYNVFAINGVTIQQAVTAWWSAAGAQPAAANWHWDCEYSTSSPHGCNPTCG